MPAGLKFGVREEASQVLLARLALIEYRLAFHLEPNLVVCRTSLLSTRDRSRWPLRLGVRNIKIRITTCPLTVHVLGPVDMRISSQLAVLVSTVQC